MADNIPKDSPLYVEKEIHLLDYLHVIQRRWRIALIVFLLVFAGVAAYTFVKTPLYQAGVAMRIGYKSESSNMLKLGLEASRGFAYPTLDSEVQILLSWTVAEKVVNELGLDWEVADGPRDADLRLRLAQVPADMDALQIELTGFLPAPQPLVETNDPPLPVAQYVLQDAVGRELNSGTSGTLLEADDIHLQVDVLSGNIGDQFILQRIPFDQAVGKALAGAGAEPAGEDGFMLNLSVVSADPVAARDLANALARAYQRQNAENKARQAELMLDFIKQHLVDLGRRLDESEQSLQEFTIRTGLKRLSPEGSSLVNTAVDLERQKAELSLQKERLDVFVATRARTDDFSAVASITGVEQYLNRLLELRGRRSELLRSYTEAHPNVVAVTEEINQTRAAILGLAEQTLGRLRLEIADIEKELRESGRKLEEVPEEEYELVRLTRANQVNAELYSYLLQRQQEIRITQAATVSDVEIINWAQTPGVPFTPNKRKNIALGLILGLMLGVGLAFLLDYLDRTIKDEEDIQERFGLPVLGVIPQILDDRLKQPRQLITKIDPLSAQSEAFLALRTNLLYLVTNRKHRTIMLTSCLSGEGKSTIAANLAVTLAQTGAKVLVLDCDMRRPSLYKIFNQSETPGLSELLVSNDRGPLRRIEDLDLDYIPAGSEPTNPTQMLTSEKMQRFLEAVRVQYDYVVIDAPPILPVADALILASKVDLNVLAIESCRVPEKLVKRALKALQHHGAELAGVVLNDKTGKGSKFYGAYSYNGKYYQGYYRRNEPEPVPTVWRRTMSKVWNFING